ncbi:hypothetical protein H6P81_002158 [Aristolochia fimbriata]|uniref:NADP-dependent oxidoreductase domain-containing protein n=1 Tax=Aristolochia fimbriata TaxID=158543 RepID=A0AAV7F8Z2_ARIFI|nr:hypothetical protein H6P81_002158 [Aristolochia fimbriata]
MVVERRRNLGLEYVDLYLIHWPIASRRREIKAILDKNDMEAMDVKAVWESMETASALGLAKSIGVSNFSSKKLQDLLTIANIPPAVNQVEMNVGWQQKKLMEFCKQKGIHVTAWAPLSCIGARQGSVNILTSPILREIAEAKGKSVAQVALRWLHNQGVSVIAKSFKKERMEENLGIFGWQLTKEEEQKISQMPQRRGQPKSSYRPRSPKEMHREESPKQHPDLVIPVLKEDASELGVGVSGSVSHTLASSLPGQH